MVAEEIVVAIEESMAAVRDKGKKVDTSSGEKDFDLRHLGGVGDRYPLGPLKK